MVGCNVPLKNIPFLWRGQRFCKKLKVQVYARHLLPLSRDLYRATPAVTQTLVFLKSVFVWTIS